jgi:hypothetical protein
MALLLMRKGRRRRGGMVANQRSNQQNFPTLGECQIMPEEGELQPSC